MTPDTVHCPHCGRPWDPGRLAQHLARALRIDGPAALAMAATATAGPVQLPSVAHPAEPKEGRGGVVWFPAKAAPVAAKRRRAS